MVEKFEDQYLDVLQNIEFALVSVYREQPKMTDWAALYTVESLIKTYTAELRKQSPPRFNLQPHEQEAYDRVKAICNWRLGREEMRDKEGKPVELGIEPRSLDEIIACLKRIHTSINRWQKKLGKRGYFEFVSQFIK